MTPVEVDMSTEVERAGRESGEVCSAPGKSEVGSAGCGGCD